MCGRRTLNCDKWAVLRFVGTRTLQGSHVYYRFAYHSYDQRLVEVLVAVLAIDAEGTVTSAIEQIDANTISFLVHGFEKPVFQRFDLCFIDTTLKDRVLHALSETFTDRGNAAKAFFARPGSRLHIVGYEDVVAFRVSRRLMLLANSSGDR